MNQYLVENIKEYKAHSTLHVFMVTKLYRQYLLYNKFKTLKIWMNNDYCVKHTYVKHNWKNVSVMLSVILIIFLNSKGTKSKH